MTEFNSDSNDEQFDLPKENKSSHAQADDAIPCRRKGKEFSCAKKREGINTSAINVDELNHKIIKIKLLIQEKFPGLSILLDEMPITAPENQCTKVCFYDLKDYYNSIEAILNKYKLEHPES